VRERKAFALQSKDSHPTQSDHDKERTQSTFFFFKVPSAKNTEMQAPVKSPKTIQ
jgi:hypothetical protein